MLVRSLAVAVVLSLSAMVSAANACPPGSFTIMIRSSGVIGQAVCAGPFNSSGSLWGNLADYIVNGR